MSSNNGPKQPVESEITEKPKRKRGRPRKNAVSTPVEKKQRGRKPGTKNTVKKNPPKAEEDEEIILHIPGLSFKDMKTIEKTDTDTYQSETNNENNENNENENERSSSSPKDTNIFTIADISNNYSSSEDIDSVYSVDNEEYIQKLRERDEIIYNLEAELKKYRDIVNDNFDNGLESVKTVKMDVKFVSSINGKQFVCEETDICCWWCTYNFDSMPCFIPERVVDDTFYVFGCFCSYNCAAAYNIEMGDYKVWDRYSLIKTLYNTLTGTNDDVPIAPRREILKKFGGVLTIEEYRKNNRSVKKEFRLVMPPMVSIVPFIEEKYSDSSNIKKLRSVKGGDDYVLKRTKPLPNSKSTLEDFFQKL